MLNSSASSQLIGLYGTKGLNTEESLKQRIVDIVTLMDENSMAVSVRDLNRRFSRPLSALGLSISDVIASLANEGKVLTQIEAGRSWLLSPAFETFAEGMVDRGEYGDEFAYLDAVAEQKNKSRRILIDRGAKFVSG